MNVEFPVCRLGGHCDVVSLDGLLGRVGVGQCVRCSTVYEATGWRPRVCGSCGMTWGDSVHDPCLGELSGVLQACCGHGDPSRAYRIHADGTVEGRVP